jgi:ABC-type bacteriocin/lantibiotic exporter with double-glycine peptidase domain
MLNLPISRDSFLWAFSITSQINRVPMAINFVMHKYQPPFTLGSFRAAVEQAGMKVRQKAVPNSQLSKLPLPCLITLIPAVEAVPMAINGDGTVAANTIREYHMALVESLDDERVVLAEACSQATTTLSRAVFEKRFAGEVLIISPQAAASIDSDHATGLPPQVEMKQASARTEQRKIGLSWFMPQAGWLRTMFRAR